MSEALSLLYQRNWTASLMQIALRPLNPEISSEDFYDEIASRVLDGMRARYVIIRLIVHGSDRHYLKCVAVKDRKSDLHAVPLDAYDVGREDATASVYETAEQEFASRNRYLRFIRRSDDAALFAAMTQSPGMDSIRTILVSALTLSDRVRGFINVGYDVPVHLNDYLSATFATSFNQMGVAIENHQTLCEINGLRRTEIDEFLQRSNVQFIQGFRHLAQTALIEADDAHYRMLKSYHFKGAADDDPSRKLKIAHKEIEAAFSRMAALKNLDQKFDRTSIVKAFEEAMELVRYQMIQADVDVRVVRLSSGPLDARINVEGMHHAFGNLMLNSIEAFQEANTRKIDRRITVQFRKERGTIMIDFGDDGPGVRLGRNIRSFEDIWLPEKTTKRTGTGYGLPFVRMIIQDLHRGSINLRDSRRGALFRIAIPDGLDRDS